MSEWDVLALVIVVGGFVLYSSGGLHLQGGHATSSGKMLPLQAAGGSMLYVRERSNSDPDFLKSPRYTPKSATSRFGRFSPAARMLQHGSPKLSRGGDEGRPLVPAEGPLGIQYAAIGSTSAIGITLLPSAPQSSGQQEASSL